MPNNSSPLTLSMTEAEALITLNQLPKTGPVKIRRLLDQFGSAASILRQSPSQLQKVPGIGPEIATLISEWENHADPTAEINLAHERNIKILTQKDEDYPVALRESFDAPVILYVWGTLLPKDLHAVAIVGSRKMTHYGRETARKFGYQLAGAGLTVISGLARGIDTAAHEGAVAAKGRTIGVLGSGLMQLYPPENLALAERIADGHGAIISEFPLQNPPDRQTFPQRNRIVANWARSLLVVECPSRSGSLITANLAAEAGRQIYAVPGPIDRPTSSGCHDLIRDGATLVTDGSHILQDFQNLNFKPPGEIVPRPTETFLDLNEEENRVMSALRESDRSVDELVEVTGLATHQISVILMKLELRKLVQTLHGQRFSLA
ncbi:MAG: DNA-processing protein DprA [Akkermansiaceae bacterium]